jgi:tetratricopeptide (TPR) repeat protein
MPEPEFEQQFEAGCAAYAEYRFEAAAAAFSRCLELEANDKQSRFRLALALMRCNQPGNAWTQFLYVMPIMVLEAMRDKNKNPMFGMTMIAHLCKSAEQVGKSPEEIAYCRGLVHLARHTIIPFDKDEAVLAMRELQKLQNNAMALLFRGLALTDNNDALQATQEFSKAIELDSTLGMAYRFRAINLAANQNHREAIEDAEQAIAFLGPTQELCEFLAEEYLILGRFDEALEVTTESIPICPDKRKIYYVRGAAHYRLGKVDEALADLGEAVRLTISDRSDATKQSVWSRGEAIGACDDRINSVSADHRTLFTRGMAHYFRGLPTRDQVDFAKAENDLNAAIAIDAGVALYHVGRALLKSLTAHPEARQDCNEAIKLDPTLVDAYVVRASLSGDPNLKKTEFAEAFAVAPNNNDLLRAHTFFYSTRGNPDDKLQALDLQIQRTEGPVAPHLYAERGHLKLKANNAPGAMEDFRRALRLNPELVEALRGRRQAYFQLGDWDTAKLDEAELNRLEAPLAAPT